MTFSDALFFVREILHGSVAFFPSEMSNIFKSDVEFMLKAVCVIRLDKSRALNVSLSTKIPNNKLIEMVLANSLN